MAEIIVKVPEESTESVIIQLLDLTEETVDQEVTLSAGEEHTFTIDNQDEVRVTVASQAAEEEPAE